MTGGGVNVQFCGLQKADVVKKLMAESKLMVVPSEWFEGLPMTMVEAITEGTPMVVSDMGALPEFIK